MKLETLLQGVETVSKPRDMDVHGMAFYVHEVESGCVFCCPSSAKSLIRAGSAVLKGARVLVCEHRLPIPVPQIVVSDAIKAMKTMCANYLHALNEQLMVIGVTGTNGKTSTTFMIKSILEANGIRTGLIGTVECMAGDEKLGPTITTPIPSRLIRLFSRMLETGCRAVVMEASSEGLEEDRLRGLRLTAGVFTNLTQDHLDYHGTMEAYAAAKKKMFSLCTAAAFNTDSEYSPYMADHFPGTSMTYGIHHPSDLQALDIQYHTDHTDFTLALKGRSFPVCLPVPGEFNVYNALACASACLLAGMKPENIVKGMHGIHTVPGRIERIPTPGRPFSVILDYAHTPDGLENILHAVRGITKGRIITVFGCGGKRDRTKRPLMGYAAGHLSDYCFVTSDNPRNEKPMDIIRDILPGMEKSGCPFEVEEDRTTAIEKAIRFAKSGDTVVLAGKGHEQFQEIQGVKHPFDERAIVRDALAKLDSTPDSRKEAH